MGHLGLLRETFIFTFTKAFDRDIRSAIESEIAERSWVAILTKAVMPRRLYSAGSLISSRRVVTSTKNMSHCAPLTTPPSQGRREIANIRLSPSYDREVANFTTSTQGRNGILARKA